MDRDAAARRDGRVACSRESCVGNQMRREALWEGWWWSLNVRISPHWNASAAADSSLLCPSPPFLRFLPPFFIPLFSLEKTQKRSTSITKKSAKRMKILKKPKHDMLVWPTELWHFQQADCQAAMILIQKKKVSRGRDSSSIMPFHPWYKTTKTIHSVLFWKTFLLSWFSLKRVPILETPYIHIRRTGEGARS